MSDMYKMLCKMGQEEAIKYLDDITSSKFIKYVKDTLDELGLTLSFENIYSTCVILDLYPFNNRKNSFDGLLDNKSCSLNALSKKELSHIFTNTIRLFGHHPEEEIVDIYDNYFMRPFDGKDVKCFKHIYWQYKKFFYLNEEHRSGYKIAEYNYHLYISAKLYELYNTKIIVDKKVREKLNYIDFDKYAMFFKKNDIVAEEENLLGYLFDEVENQVVAEEENLLGYLFDEVENQVVAPCQVAAKVLRFLNDQMLQGKKWNPAFYDNFKQDIFVNKKGISAVLKKKKCILESFVRPDCEFGDDQIPTYDYEIYYQRFVVASKNKDPIFYNHYNLSFIVNLEEFVSDDNLFRIVNTFNRESKAKVANASVVKVGKTERLIFSSNNKNLMHDVLKSCVYLEEVLTKTGFLNPNHHNFDESDILFPKIEACVKNTENKIFITFDIDKSYYSITNIHNLFKNMPDNKTKICFLSLYRLIRDTRSESLPITVASPLLFKMFMSNIIEKNDDTLMFVDDCFIYGKDEKDIESKLLKLLEYFEPYFKINSFKVTRRSKDRGVAFMNKLFNFDDDNPMKDPSTTFDSDAANDYFRIRDLCKTSPVKNNLKECRICLLTAKMGVLKCGHVICELCYKKVENCPFCREPIKGWSLIYID